MDSFVLRIRPQQPGPRWRAELLRWDDPSAPLDGAAPIAGASAELPEDLAPINPVAFPDLTPVTLAAIRAPRARPWNAEELVAIGEFLRESIRRDTLAASWDAITPATVDQDRRLLLDLPAALSDLPWEALRHHPLWYAGSGRMPIARVRSSEVASPRRPPFRRPLRVMVVVGAWAQDKRVEWSAELAAIESAILRVGRDGSNECGAETLVDLQVVGGERPAPTRRELVDEIVAFAPHALHFIGHGAIDPPNGPRLVVSTGEHSSWPWLAKDILNDLQDSVPWLVYLNACHGASPVDGWAVSTPFLRLGAAAVVAASGALRGDVAALIAGEFYRHLLGRTPSRDPTLALGRPLEAGGGVDIALARARAAASKSEKPEGHVLLTTLTMQAHPAALMKSRPRGAVHEAVAARLDQIPATCPVRWFVGRRRERRDLLGHVKLEWETAPAVQRSPLPGTPPGVQIGTPLGTPPAGLAASIARAGLVILHGEADVGKSQFARALARVCVAEGLDVAWPPIDQQRQVGAVPLLKTIRDAVVDAPLTVDLTASEAAFGDFDRLHESFAAAELAARSAAGGALSTPPPPVGAQAAQRDDLLPALFDALIKGVRDVAAGRGLLVVLDDLRPRSSIGGVVPEQFATQVVPRLLRVAARTDRLGDATIVVVARDASLGELGLDSLRGHALSFALNPFPKDDAVVDRLAREFAIAVHGHEHIVPVTAIARLLIRAAPASGWKPTILSGLVPPS